jgi:hypothetical protein
VLYPAHLGAGKILKLALIGFVFPESPNGPIFVILSDKDAYVHLAFSKIGFVLHNTLKMVIVFCSD